MGHLERRKKEKEKIRKGILKAALNIAKSDGWNALTIRAIADKIEYTPPIVYEYFNNKEDLLNELVKIGHLKLHKANEDVFNPDLTPQKILMELSLNLWDFAFKNKELYNLMFNLDRKIPDELLHEFQIKITDLFVSIVGSEEKADELMFNWICLQQGYIITIKQMGLPPHLKKNKLPRDLYQRAIERFISNL